MGIAFQFDVTPAGLRAFRAHWGLTLSQLAGDLGLDTSTLHRWETGAADPRTPVMLRLAMSHLAARYGARRKTDLIYADKAREWEAQRNSRIQTLKGVGR